MIKSSEALETFLNASDDMESDYSSSQPWTAANFPHPVTNAKQCRSTDSSVLVCDPDGVLSDRQRAHLERRVSHFNTYSLYKCPFKDHKTPLTIAAVAARQIEARPGATPEQAAAEFGRALFGSYASKLASESEGQRGPYMVGDTRCRDGMLLVYEEKSGASALVLDPQLYALLSPEDAITAEELVTKGGAEGRQWSAHKAVSFGLSRASGLSDGVDYLLEAATWGRLKLWGLVICVIAVGLGVPFLVSQLIGWILFLRFKSHYEDGEADFAMDEEGRPIASTKMEQDAPKMTPRGARKQRRRQQGWASPRSEAAAPGETSQSEANAGRSVAINVNSEGEETDEETDLLAKVKRN